MSSNIISLLKTKRFLPLFVTQFLGAFNDNLFRTALVTLVTYHIATIAAETKPLLVTIAMGLFMLPFFLFSATAGQLADKFNKIHIIRWVKLSEVVMMGMAAYGFMTHNAYFLIFVLFLMGTHSAFFGPVKYSILPDHLHKDELLGGNGLIEAGTFLSILLGTILGGLLIGETTSSTALVSASIIGVSLLGFAACFFIPATKPAAPDLNINWNIMQETWNIIKNAKENRSVFLSIVGISWFWLVGALFLSQMPHFAKDILQVSQPVFTALLTTFSIGIGVGSILCNTLLKGEVSSRYVPIAAILMTVFIFDMSYASTTHSFGNGEPTGLGGFLTSIAGWRILIDLFLIAAFGGIYIVPLYAIMQSRSEPSHRSRIIAANNILNSLFMVVSSVIATILLSMHVSIPDLFYGVGVANALVALYICKLLPETVFKSVAKGLLRLFYHVEVRGMEHYRDAGKRVLIIANHVSFLDAAVIAAFMPDRVTFAINSRIAQLWWIRPLLSLIKTFPLDPLNPMAAKGLIDELKKDEKVVIFPEGRLTMTGSLMKVYEGPAMIAEKSNALLLPVRLEGVQFTPLTRLHGKLHVQWFPKITLTILPPRKLKVEEGLSSKQHRRVASNMLYDMMSDLMFESSNYQQTLFQSVLDASSKHGVDHPIAEDIDRKPLTYQQLITRSYILGKYIARTSKEGEYIGVMLPNAVSTLVTFFGLQAFGRIPAMLNFSSGVQNIVSACKTASIKTVYTSQKFIEAANLQSLEEGIKEAGVKVVHLEEARNQITLLHKIFGVIAARFPQFYYTKITKSHNPDSPALVLFTSGSEGTPKGVVLSHTNIQANVAQLSARIDFNSQDIVFNTLPMFHSFGLTAGTLLPVLSGIKTFLYPSPLHYRVIPELVYDTNATILFGTDTFLINYARFAHAYDFYSVRYVFAGAEKLKEETRRIWSEKFGVRIFEGYGATETSPVLAVNTPMQNKAGTVGRLLPGITCRIESIQGIEEGGRLYVQGPNVMLGYLFSDNPGILVPAEGGWHDTGDIVDFDAEGYITIKGRAKRFAKIGGEMVSLTAVEEYISRIWPDHSHAVAALPDPKKGEQLILITNNPDAAKDVIIAHVKEHGISELSIPKKIAIIDSIPVLGTGKTDYVSVQKLAEQYKNQNNE